MRQFIATFDPPSGLIELEPVNTDDDPLCVDQCSRASSLRAFRIAPGLTREEICERLPDPTTAWLNSMVDELPHSDLPNAISAEASPVCRFSGRDDGVPGEHGWCAYSVVYPSEMVELWKADVHVHVYMCGPG